MGNRKIAISDIHGCCKTFKALLNKINFNINDELYLLGDYIDRGKNSKGVIDFIWKLQKDGYKVYCLRGNHEQMMLEASRIESKIPLWLWNGGDTTLRSFGVEHINAVPDEYTRWLQLLPFYFLVDNYILVHAGLNFKKESPLSERRDMVWIRNWYDDLDKEWLQEAIIIHGHTTTEKKQIEEMLLNINELPVLAIDNGCVFTRKSDRGRLCAFDLVGQKLFFQENIE